MDQVADDCQLGMKERPLLIVQACFLYISSSVSPTPPPAPHGIHHTPSTLTSHLHLRLWTMRSTSPDRWSVTSPPPLVSKVAEGEAEIRFPSSDPRITEHRSRRTCPDQRAKGGAAVRRCGACVCGAACAAWRGRSVAEGVKMGEYLVPIPAGYTPHGLFWNRHLINRCVDERARDICTKVQRTPNTSFQICVDVTAYQKW